jgi:hypothetical protein
MCAPFLMAAIELEPERCMVNTPAPSAIYAPGPRAQGLSGKKVQLQVIPLRTTPWKNEPK